MTRLRVTDPILKSVLKHQLDEARDAVVSGHLERWIHAEVDKYLSALSRSDTAEERRTAIAKAKATHTGMGEVLTVREAAALLKVHTVTIRNYVRKGILQGRKIVKRILIRKASVTKLLGALPPEEGGAK
jgi:excisionase family DNA binding protein